MLMLAVGELLYQRVEGEVQVVVTHRAYLEHQVQGEEAEEQAAMMLHLVAQGALASLSFVTPSINRHQKQQQETLRSITPMVIRYIHGRLPGQLLFKEN